MNQSDSLYWLQYLTISGREGDEEEGEEGQEDEGDDDGDDGEESEDEGEDKGGDEGDEDPGDDPVKLKAKLDAKEKALREERKLRRKAEREAKQSRKKRTDRRDQTKDTQTQKELETTRSQNHKLAQGLLKREVDSAILEEARRQGFIDPTDALSDDIREDVDVDQDEDDPSQIEVDADSVKDAVADLAARKKHLVGSSDDSPGGRSGGKFKKKNKGEGNLDDAALQQNYPALR